MATTDAKIFRINDYIANINAAQIAVEPANDADLGYRMYGGKDAAGNVQKWLAKDKPIRAESLGLIGTDYTGEAGLLRHDTNGAVVGKQMTVAELNSMLSDGPIGGGVVNLPAGELAYGGGITGLESEDTLFWDSANDYLGIGTDTPECALDVVGDANLNARMMISLYSSSGSGFGRIDIRRSASDTIGSHAAVNTSTRLGELFFYGSNGASFSTGAYIGVYPTETWSAPACGTKININACADGSPTPTHVATFWGGGDVDISGNLTVGENGIGKSLVVGPHTITATLDNCLVGGSLNDLSGSMTHQDSILFGKSFDIDQIVNGCAIFGNGHVVDIDTLNYSIVAGVGHDLYACGYVSVFGRENTISSEYGSASGYDNNNNKNYSDVRGYQCRTNWVGARHFSGGQVNGTNSSQCMDGMSLQERTTDATPVSMKFNASDSVSPLYCPDGTIQFYWVTLIAASDTGTYSGVKVWEFDVMVMRQDPSFNVITCTGISTSEDRGTLPGSVTVTLVEDSTDEIVEVQVTGEASTVVNWVAHITRGVQVKSDYYDGGSV